MLVQYSVPTSDSPMHKGMKYQQVKCQARLLQYNVQGQQMHWGLSLIGLFFLQETFHFSFTIKHVDCIDKADIARKTGESFAVCQHLSFMGEHLFHDVKTSVISSPSSYSNSDLSECCLNWVLFYINWSLWCWNKETENHIEDESVYWVYPLLYKITHDQG